LTPNPIRKVLSTLSSNEVRCLLMGGQACVFYGGAEFSRDTDLVLLPDTETLERLSRALEELHAERIAVPPFEARHLKRGHAVHFRCQHPDAKGMRVDVMSVLRGVDPFPELWARRTTVELGPGEAYDLLALPDLVRAKRTQRDKDWLMIQRLVEANYVAHRENPTAEQVAFWLGESRAPARLVELAKRHPERTRELAATRPLLAFAMAGNLPELARALKDEEQREREKDRAYWAPLVKELEQMRREERR